MNPFSSVRVIVGVTGSIAAFKAAALVSNLVQAGAEVDVILSPGARHFIQPLTFSALTRRPVHHDLFTEWTSEFAGHITLARNADLFLVAPASANAIARFAAGVADGLLESVYLSTTAPVLLAPAMEHHMLHHPATQQNLDTLRSRGVTIIDPEPGRLASGAEGDGRLADAHAILGTMRRILGRQGVLAGRHLVVTAGGTREALDPVRYLGNRSSGHMGFALAQAALDLGASVTLVSGPSSLTPPYGAEVRPVETAAEMRDVVAATVRDADALIMAAAVADFRASEAAPHKLKKQPGEQSRSVPLVRTPDILESIHQPGLLKIGFAAETENLIDNARRKLESKGLSLIVANDAVSTIGSDESAAVMIESDRPPRHLSRQSKGDLAAVIMRRVAVLLQENSRVEG